MKRGSFMLLLIFVPILAAIALFFYGPIPQDPAYHHFADQRGWLGITNFGDVLSNLPFLLIGLSGVALMIRGNRSGDPLRPAYLVFFIGTALIGLGSAYYHLVPNNATLVWDRLPMTFVFMAFVSIVVGSCLNARLGARLLWPLVVFGAVSVAVWAVTDDLRLYIFAQFVPLILLPILLIARPPARRLAFCFWGTIIAYAVAKVLETADAPVFHALHVVSGHSLKHVAAAIGTAFLLGAAISGEGRSAPGVARPPRSRAA